MRRRSGYIFVEALVVIACLVALMVMLAADQKANMQVVQTRLRERRAEAAADSAVQRAMTILSTANTNLVQQSDDWALQGNGGTAPTNSSQVTAGSDEFDFSDGSAHFRMQILDAGSLLNINLATADQLTLLPLTQDQVDSLLDWRETGTQPRSDGAKDQYYNTLTQPYNTKLGALDTVDELLLVKGWTGQTLYQTPQVTTTLPLPTDQNNVILPLASMLTVDSGAPNTQADGTARINLGARGVNVAALTRLGISPPLANQLAARAPFTSFQALSAVPGMNSTALGLLLNAVTFTTTTRTQGLINLNTASQAVLQTLPNMTSDVASAIVAQQSGGFSTLGALANVSGLSAPLLGQLADSFTIGSDTWLVRAYGESGGVGVALEVVVGMRNGQIQVVNWERLNSTTVPTWWNWLADPSQTLDAGAAE
jgi:type II secretory pathway component PulK